MHDEPWAEFLDRLVHDIREPLRSVTAFSEMLKERAGDPSGPEGDHVLDEIISGASRIGGVIDGVSRYSLALRPPPAGETASLQLAFNIAVMSLDREIQSCGATVVGAELPKVGVSLDRLIQLLENLIGNALRFRGDAPPHVRVSAAEDAQGRWIVRVEDNGVGINAADCMAVFKPFTRLHGRKYPGSGLGLAICRTIIEAYGGTIQIQPGTEKGSVVVFTLPAAA